MPIDDTKKYYIDHGWWWIGLWNVFKESSFATIFQANQKIAKILLGSFGVTMTLKIFCLGSRPPLKHIDERNFKISSNVNSVKPKVTTEDS